MTSTVRSNLRNSVWGAVRIIRPINIVMTVAGTFAGAILTYETPADITGTLGRTVLAALAVALTTAGGNVMNDLVDRTTDSVNRPDRPLSSNAVSSRGATVLLVFLCTGALIVGFRLSGVHAAFVAVVLLLLAAYNLLFKRIPLVGNIAVSGLVASSLLFGALDRLGGSLVGWSGAAGTAGAADMNTAVWVGCAFAFWVSLAREIVKDIQDLPGDTAAGISTLPSQFGIDFARRTVVALCAGVTIFTVVPYIYLEFSGLYLLSILLTDTLLVQAIAALRSDPSDPARASATLKKSMAAGLIALMLARIPAPTP